MSAAQHNAVVVSERRNLSQLSGLVAALCLSFIIALAPLPFGSMDQRVIAIWVLLLSATLLLSSLQELSSRDLTFLWCFAAVVAAWALVIVEQLSEAPIFAGQLVPSIWKDTSDIIGRQLAGTISVARNQPYFSLGSQLACMLSIACGFLVGRDRRGAFMLVYAFAGSALVYALYGILAFIFWPNYLLWHERFNYLGSLTATFINPNVAAVYFGAAAICWVLLFADSIKFDLAGSGSQWRSLIPALFRNPARRTPRCFAAAMFVLATTLMTSSRAGSILTLLAISGALATFFRRELGSRGLLLGFPVSAAAAILLTLQLFGARVNQRFGLEGLFDVGRWNAYLSTLHIIKDHPWLGTGLGTFRWAFPQYRSGNVPAYGTWEQAHNTTLEIASEMGIPFTILIAAAWLAMFAVIGNGVLIRKRDEILPIIAFWVGLLAIVHSQIDFSLQIPGFSLVACSLVGMGMAQSVSSRARL